MLKVGDAIKVKTTTKDDVFGECVYKVVEVGLKCPFCKKDDGIRFSMFGGTGPAARPGYLVTDCPERVQNDIKRGVTVVLTSAQANLFEKHYSDKGASRPSHEIEM
jgi:hypothetical protein